MKRPMLISGITVTLTAAVFLCFKEIAALCLAAFGASAFVVFFIFKKKIKNSSALAALLISAVTVASSLCFSAFFGIYEKPSTVYTRGEYDVNAYLSELPEYREDGSVTYVFKTESVNGEKKNFKFSYTAKSAEKIGLYDTVSFKDMKFYGISGKASDKAYSYSEKIFLKVKDFSSFSVLFKKEKTPYYFCLMFKDGCIKNMKKYLSRDSAAILSGMVFGDKSFMRSEVKNAFKASGVSHIMAVSGLHASLWCGILAALLKLFSVSERKKAAISILFLVLLCTLSAFTPSVIRASLMTALVLTGPLFKRKADSLNSLGFAVAALLSFNPYLLFTPSFLLSASATAGVIFSTAVERRLKAGCFKLAVFGKIYSFVRSNVIVSAVSSVFTMPVCVLFFKSFCTVSPVTNILVVQPSFYAMASGLFASVFAFVPSDFASYVSKVLFFIPEILLKFVKLITFSVSKIPFSQLPAGLFTVCVFGFSVAVFLCVIKCFEKSKKKHVALKITAYFLCVALVAVSAFSSFLPISVNREMTLVSSNGSPKLVLRCGGEYALLGAPDSKNAQYEIKNCLPTTKEEKLSYFVLVSQDSGGALEFVFENYSPQIAVTNEKLTQGGEKLLKSSGALSSKALKFVLNDKINVEIVDTQGECYAIIKDGNKKAAVSLSKEGGAPERADILVLGESEAKEFSGFCDELFVCTKNEADMRFAAELSAHCNKLYVLSDGESRLVKL